MEIYIRNLIVSCVSGTVFGLAWWLMVDIVSYYPDVLAFHRGLVLMPIVLGTISIIITAAVPNSSLYENLILTRLILTHRFIFFFAMTLGFAGVLSAIIICTTTSLFSFATMYVILGIPLANLMVLGANIAFKFAVIDDDLIC